MPPLKMMQGEHTRCRLQQGMREKEIVIRIDCKGRREEEGGSTMVGDRLFI